MLTDATIRSALRAAPTSGKAVIELKDGGARGEGRLALFIRVTLAKPDRPGRISTEWYVVWYRSERRKLAKIASYPTMSLADARKTFRENYAPMISRGDQPARPRARKPGGITVKDMFEAYIAHLVKQKKDASGPKKYLLGSKLPATGRWKGVKTECASDAIGSNMAASAVTHKHIIPHLKEIHDRGAVGAASHARAYISAAFSFAMQSANAYHREAGDVDWGISLNPVTAIPFDPKSKKAGTRHLTPAEYREFWGWLLARASKSRAAPVLLLCMATGQRLTEILCLTDDQAVAATYRDEGIRLGVYDPVEKMLDWSKTKNKSPHALPLASQAVGVLNAASVNRHRLYFPQRIDESKVLTIAAAEQLVDEYLKHHPGVARFTPRDIRRTWKTLAGAAGLSKEIRDRLQNHAIADVSSRHYDRYSYLPEKRAAVTIWSAYMDRILCGDLDLPLTRLEVGTVAGRA